MRSYYSRPVANWGLPLAAIADITGKDPEFISGPMTVALTSYSYVNSLSSLRLSSWMKLMNINLNRLVFMRFGMLLLKFVSFFFLEAAE